MSFVLPLVASAASTAPLPPDPNWLTIVNDFRAQSGLPAVAENKTWSKGTYYHSCWMLENGIAHDEATGTPLYTTEGDAAGNNSDVAVSSAFQTTSKSHIELWMTGPYHALGILRSGISAMGYGECHSSTGTKWRSGASLNVLSGLNTTIKRTAPVVFPGPSATTRLDRFVAETPNPLTPCKYTAPAGLPLLALMPETFSSASATLTGPTGPLEVCTLTKYNAVDPSAVSNLGGENGIVIIPRNVLAAGTYTASVRTSARSYSWSFTVDTARQAAASVMSQTSATATAGLFQPINTIRRADTRSGLGGTKLAAATVRQIQITGGGVPSGYAASLQVTSLNAAAAGAISFYPCTGAVPLGALAVTPSVTTANSVTVGLSGSGSVCVYSTAATDLLIDVSGVYGSTGYGLTTLKPARVYDSRVTGAGGRIAANTFRKVQVTGRGGVAAGTPAAVLAVTAVAPSAAGYLALYPCGTRTTQSLVNYPASSARTQTAHALLASDGAVCVFSSAAVDLVVDVVGTYQLTGASTTPLHPIRLIDTRDRVTNVLTAGTAALGLVTNRRFEFAIPIDRSIPAGSAYSLNVAVVSPVAAGSLQVRDCNSTSSGTVLNYPAGVTTSSGIVVSAVIPASSSSTYTNGSFCVLATTDTHFVADLMAVHS